MGKVPKARELSRFGYALSRPAQLRLQWMTHYLQNGRNAAFTCRHFGMTRQTFYRWWRRYDPHNLTSLEDRSHRPHHRRQPTWTAAQSQAVLDLRREYPRWGKDKLVVVLRRKGLRFSTSMVGRILGDLNRRGILVEARPLAAGWKARKKMQGRPWARRKPRFWPIRQPGDLVQLDTKDIRPQRGVVLKHFSARDMVSRWDVLEVHERATSLAAAHFLDSLLNRMPFPIAALQVDGGSEFAAEFETACQQRGLPLFVLPPRSPKLNGQVERSHRTHHEEFYQVIPDHWNIESLNPQLRRWEHIYNTVRPHQALGYRTPLECVEQWKSQSNKAQCH
ncbi:MAG TPA: integrase core domain-containing protein [Candidatus Acidoferrales bacterium]|nr:integrase core domain-containing protein [Candidatus Acidoferrales bacterium]